MNKIIKSGCALALVSLFTVPVLAAGPQGGWMVNKGNTMGYALMTPAERAEHQAKMRSFKTYDECVAYTAEHHKIMEERAKEKNITLPGFQKGKFGCDNMKAKGFLK